MDPKAPMVRVHWFDAGFCRDERIYGPKFEVDYKSGCPDLTVGYYLGTVNGCVVLAESVYARKGEDDSYRHIWNIPVGMIIKVDLLTVTNQKHRRKNEIHPRNPKGKRRHSKSKVGRQPQQ